MQEDSAKTIRALKGEAKRQLTELLKEICRRCPRKDEDVSSPVCIACPWRRKEEFIRAALE